MRRAIAGISLDLMLVMCQQSESPFVMVTANPLPDDAKIVGFNTRVFGDAETGPTTIDCIVESESFADVPDDTPISDLPRLPLTRFLRIGKEESVTTSIFDSYLKEAAEALCQITPYDLTACHAIILAIAQYKAIEELAALLPYAGAPLVTPSVVVRAVIEAPS